MAEIKAITPSGIVHNTTKIGTQDGQLEDLVNLRFKDGSWRTTGDGAIINTSSNVTYSQLYVHTNAGYRHLLGVKNGKLYWFANLTPKEDSADVSKELFEYSAITAVEITSVTGNVTITQNGHLITIIDGSGIFKYFVYKNNSEYKEVVVQDNNGNNDRSLFPLDFVHFNLYTDIDDDTCCFTKESGIIYGDGGNFNNNADAIPTISDEADAFIAEVQGKNRFVDPFLITYALKLYDGSYSFIGNPILLNPREAMSRCDRYRNAENDTIVNTQEGYEAYAVYDNDKKKSYAATFNTETTLSSEWVETGKNDIPTYTCGMFWDSTVSMRETFLHRVVSSKIVASIEDANILETNKDIFTAIAIFVTPQISTRTRKEVSGKDYGHRFIATVSSSRSGGPRMFVPFLREEKDVVYDLVHSNMYLLREYDSNSISELLSNGIVNLDGKEYEGVVASINKGAGEYKISDGDFSRKSIIPSYAYMYNGRLHLANYETIQFHGYPIDSFQCSNHSVKVDNDKVYLGISGIDNNNDSVLQYERSKVNIYSGGDDVPSFIIVVSINTNDGDQTVCRYITSKSSSPTNYVEDLCPILSFPDYRAKKMSIFYVESSSTVLGVERYSVRCKVFNLTVHPYLNMAYYFDPEMKPIKLSDFDRLKNTTTIDPFNPIISGNSTASGGSSSAGEGVGDNQGIS